jgi:hypothetical protein
MAKPTVTGHGTMRRPPGATGRHTEDDRQGQLRTSVGDGMKAALIPSC